MHMPIFSISAHHCGMIEGITLPFGVAKPRQQRHMALLAGESIPHDNRTLIVIDQNSEAMAAAKEVPMPTGALALRHGEAHSRDAVRRVQDGSEHVCCDNIPGEEAEQRRFPVMLAETFEELGIREDDSPVLTWKGGWLRRETEEDLLEELV